MWPDIRFRLKIQVYSCNNCPQNYCLLFYIILYTYMYVFMYMYCKEASSELKIAEQHMVTDRLENQEQIRNYAAQKTTER